MLLGAVAIIVVAWGIGTFAHPLYRNWTLAKQLHVPVILCPLTRHGLVWSLLQVALRQCHLELLWDLLPFTRLMRANWAFDEKYAICKTHGNLFALITPESVELYVADIHVAKQILSRGKNFTKPLEILKKVDVFGKNLASVEGTVWKRHRRCTAAAFSDQVNETVWAYSNSRASHTLNSFLAQECVTNTRDAMIRLSFSVLLKACMGVEQHGETGDTDHHNLDLVGAEGLLTRLLFMMSKSRLWRIPSWRVCRSKPNVFDLTRDGLKSFFAHLIDHRKHHPLPQNDLLSSLLASVDNEVLSDDEINGNLFLLMFAGHETTANTLVYIIYLLAIFPEWQSWTSENLGGIFYNEMPRDDLHHAVRIRAVIYETLRLYGPVLNILRETSPHMPQQVNLDDGSSISIPEKVQISILSTALHTHPDYWGPDPLSWIPSRWIKKTKNTTLSESQNTSYFEEIDAEKLNCLLAWSEGPRACPGKDFSQFEIIAVLMTLLRGASVHIVPHGGMTAQQAREEAYRAVQQSKLKLTLQMQSPESVHFKWKSR